MIGRQKDDEKKTNPELPDQRSLPKSNRAAMKSDIEETTIGNGGFEKFNQSIVGQACPKTVQGFGRIIV